VTIQPIVEGHGEVSAVPVLLRRLVEESGAYAVRIGKPIRRNRPDLILEQPLHNAVRLALLQPDCDAILVLLDGHEDCPKELAPTLEAWARSEARGKPCAVVMAHHEYEAWFLASIESLRGHRGIRHDAVSHPAPEEPQGAKERLEERMVPGSSYSESTDQAGLSARFDMARAYTRCRSFRRMVKVFGLLAEGAGVHLQEWPPHSWMEEVKHSAQPETDS
jgi:hypothetical protein